ncbi:unnamed protein product, partial [Ectocarpus sp. 12 AP-2014]
GTPVPPASGTIKETAPSLASRSSGLASTAASAAASSMWTRSSGSTRCPLQTIRCCQGVLRAPSIWTTRPQCVTWVMGRGSRRHPTPMSTMADRMPLSGTAASTGTM